MTFYLPSDPEPGPANPAPAPNSSAIDVLGAAWDATGVQENSWGRNDRVRAEIFAEIEARLGSFEADAPGEAAPDVGELGLEPQYQSYAENDYARRPAAERRLLARAGRLAAQRPAEYGNLPLDMAQVEAELNRRLEADWREDQAVMQAGGWGSGAAEFLGGMGRSSTGGSSLVFMLAGGPTFRPGIAGAARFMGIEGALGAAGEAFVLPQQWEQADRIGIPRPDALEAITTGFVASAGLAGLGAAAYRGFTYLAGRAAGEAELRPTGADPIDAQIDVDTAEAALREGRPVPGPAPVAQGDFDAIAGRIIGVESGGVSNAKNPNSSATGLGQFIDSTWLAMIRRHRHDLMEGRSQAQVLALRNDPAVSREMTTAYARDNAALLAAEGLPTDAGSVYLAHFAGPGTAARILRGDPGAHVSTALSPEAIRANRNIRYGGKSLPEMSLGELRRWAEVKMGSAVDPGTSWRPSTSAGYTQVGQVVTPAGTRIDVEYEVVEASTLLAASGDLQPRDRTRASSDEQIAGIAARLDPARLMPSPETDRGAPLVGPDNVVESGNGRVRAIMRAAEMHPDRMDAYRAVIAEVAPIPEGVETPVLIARRTTELDDAARVRLVQESNTSAIARMSATEQAGMDGSSIATADLELIDPRLPLSNPANQDATRALLARLPQAERAGLVDAEGRLNAAGSRRLREALVARAYDAPDMTRILAEDEGGDLRGLLEALGDAAPRWALLRDEVAAGNLQPELDATPQLLEALRMIARARAAARATPGLSVRGALEEALAQVDAFTGPVDPVTRRFVDVYYRSGGPRSQADVAALLNRYVDEAFRVGDTQQRLFAETGGATPEEVLDAIRAEDPDALGGARPGDGDAGRGAAPARSRSGDRGAGPGRDGDPVREPGDEPGDGAAGRVDPAFPPPDIRLADDADFGAGSASRVIDDRNRRLILDLRRQIEAEGDFEVATGGLIDTPDGKVAETVSARALLDELEDEQDLAEVISVCTLGVRAGGQRDA